MRWLLVCIACAAFFLAPGQTHAAGGRLRIQRPPVYLSQQGKWAREYYPQYYGGIHARNIQNIGIPSGDIGIRGNGGVTPYPW